MQNSEWLAWSLHSDEDADRLGRAVERLSAPGMTVYVDLAAHEPPPASMLAQRVEGSISTSGGRRLGAAFGASYPSYFTVAIQSMDDLIALVRLARQTGEFRVRAYETVPSADVVGGWSPNDFWDDEASRPEEDVAALVATARDDGTSLHIRSRDGYRLIGD